MPLQRQIPKKRGFKSLNPKATGLNLSIISDKFNAGQTVNPKELLNRGMIKDTQAPVKVLGSGDITKPLTFEKVLVSASAKLKIEKAGGKIAETKSQTPAA